MAERLAELQNMSRYYADDLEWSGSNSRVVNNILKDYRDVYVEFLIYSLYYFMHHIQ